MLKGGALYYAILVSFLIALLTGFLMVNLWYHHYHTLLLLQSQRQERNIRSSLTLAKEMPALFAFNQTKAIDLFDEGEDSVTLSKSYWGGFCCIKATATWKQLRHSVIELCGADIFCDDSIAVYLADKKRYLSVSGQTVLRGKCYLPELGIRRAYIEGVSFVGDQLVQGNVGVSKAELPAVETTFTETNSAYLSRSDFPNDSMLALTHLMKADSVSNSFYHKPIVFYSDQWILLSGKYLNGNIRIISSKGITIDSKSQSRDIILYAPKIEISSGFTGALQLFATDTVIVRENARLLFPSLIAMLNVKCEKPLISIEKNCRISGDIVLVNDKGQSDIQPECQISEGCQVNGRVYCQGQIQIKGTVNGSVYGNVFILRTSSSIYENHLLNATIDFKALSRHYSGSLFFNVTDRYKSVKCLD
jgi:cytoskeletal protein CcmA (bactofilin family)